MSEIPTSDAPSITYRSLLNQSHRVWHFRADCSDWPLGSLGYIERTVPQPALFKGDPVDPHFTKPMDGEVCAQCLEKWDSCG